VPYPMVQSPLLGDFLDTLKKKYAVSVEESKSALHGPRGPVSLRHLKRTVDGKVRVALLPDIGLEERIMFTVVRSICVQLRIPPADFGFNLDYLPEE
jgi:hypothetical protein